MNTSEETKGGENKTNYSFLSINHRCTIKTGYFGYFPSKIEEWDIAEDADTEDFVIFTWSNPNTLELIEAIDVRAAAQEEKEHTKQENANLKSKLAQLEEEKKQM